MRRRAVAANNADTASSARPPESSASKRGGPPSVPVCARVWSRRDTAGVRFGSGVNVDAVGWPVS